MQRASAQLRQFNVNWMRPRRGPKRSMREMPWRSSHAFTHSSQSMHLSDWMTLIACAYSNPCLK
ncbi:MAG: hypothetical protein H6730_16340 [Deltaproteobacteria bacterium]|nr:hypothetical protein [Deltaproteobacteria bacterium]